MSLSLLLEKEMEDKFLKGRQEREEQRCQRSKEGFDITELRQQYEAEAEQLEVEVKHLLAEQKVAESQERIDALRTLVQDTSNTIALTAHDMAKSNAILARLQQLVDDAKKTNAGARKFKFSSRLKAKPLGGATVSSPTSSAEKADASTVSTKLSAATTTCTRGSSTTGAGNSYGPSEGTNLFIASSKGVFVSGCTDCSIFCLPVAGSVFLSNCARCRVYVACHQLRLKDCHDTDIFVWCSSTPIIESCTGMRFGAYTCWDGLVQSRSQDGATYATHAEWVCQVGEIVDTAHTEHNYATVDDFQWVRKTASPHWRVMTEAEAMHNGTVFGPATPPNNAA